MEVKYKIMNKNITSKIKIRNKDITKWTMEIRYGKWELKLKIRKIIQSKNKSHK